MSPKMTYPKLRFEISKETIKKHTIKGKRFMNYFVEKYPGQTTDRAIRKQAAKEWLAMTPEEKDKYTVVRADGTVRLDYLNKEVRIHAETKILAY